MELHMRTILFTLSLSFTLTLFATPMEKLERKIRQDLKMLNYPAMSWRPDDNEICDVAIIGGGMRGIALAYALKLEGITNVQVFDACEEGKEGPWLTYARMKTLRSGKSLAGPSLGIPHLTFRAWYEAQGGKEAWHAMGKIPTQTWGAYLHWIKRTLDIRVKNCWRLQQILPNPDAHVTLLFEGKEPIQARQVVLATGRSGFGGPNIPEFVRDIPKQLWAHTAEVIDINRFKEKKIAVIGAGSSAFDAAACALENGAESVKMLVRRSCLPQEHPFAALSFQGFHHGYFFLPDENRAEISGKALEAGMPPPEESVARLDPFSQKFELMESTCVEQIVAQDDHLKILSSRGPLVVDFLILGTGYAVNGKDQPELATIFDSILLWNDQMPLISDRLRHFPYLGAHFEFLEKEKGTAPYLENIYCFNYGAFLSHGRISGEIDCIDVGIRRLVEGIVTKLFLQDPLRKNQMSVNLCPSTCAAGD